MSSENHVFYSAFGLSLRSNEAIPGLTPSATGNTKPDIVMILGASPPDILPSDAADLEPYYVSKETNEQGEPSFRIWRKGDSNLLRMDYADGVRFWFDDSGASLWCTWPGPLSVSDAAVYLIGPVLGLLLRLRGVTCLHASAVAFGDYAVALAGPPGAGKSTTAAALGKRGHAVVSDDIVAIEERDGRFFVLPAHPYLGLWPESVEILYGGQKKIPGFASIWDKGRLSLADHGLQFQSFALPLGAVYLLEHRTTDPGAPFLEGVLTQGSFIELVANAYGTELLEPKMRAREFELLGRVASTVPVLRLRPHADGAKLADLCDLIERSYPTTGLIG